MVLVSYLNPLSQEGRNIVRGLSGLEEIYSHNDDLMEIVIHTNRQTISNQEVVPETLVDLAINRIKWYILTNPSKRQCTQCHTTVPLSRYKEEHYLKSPISLCVPKISDFFRFTQYRVLLYEIAYRPYLQLDCPKCGEKHIICPYCHEPIQEEFVICNYDKPSICPHCGKKIYTLVPMREWERGMYIGDILD